MNIRVTNSSCWSVKGEVWTVTGIDKSLEDGKPIYNVDHPENKPWLTHYVHSDNCEIISEEAENLANVTLLPDESLGGVQREYTEVMRKARVGERIKMTDMYSSRHLIGNVYNVTKAEFHGFANFVELDGTFSDGSTLVAEDFEHYVVLEPSDIVVIEGNARYRLVERKAAVGERIIIVREISEEAAVAYYGTGDIMTVTNVDRWENGEGISVAETWMGVFHYEYRVLEPLCTVQAEPLCPAQIDDRAQQIDGLTDAVAKLTLKTAELERELTKQSVQLKVAREDIGLIEDGATDDILRLKARLADAERRIAKLETPRPVFERPVVITRDEIIERAKVDVAELVARTERGDIIINAGSMTVKFVVNRDKRTVAALIGWAHVPGVRNRGIAKCAPDDVFNVYIGKALSLRRALGLEVPDEYVNAPRPTEGRIGDVVSTKRNPQGYTLTMGWPASELVRQTDFLRFIDDSREEDEE